MKELWQLHSKANDLRVPQERTLTSPTPVVGPAIALVRRAMSSLSTKWYVRPILEQQIAFNSIIVHITGELISGLEQLEGRVARLEQEAASLEPRVSQQANHISSIFVHIEQERSRLTDAEASLTNQVRESEDLSVDNDRAIVALARELARLSHRLNEISRRVPDPSLSPPGNLASAERNGGPHPASSDGDEASLL